MATHDLPLRIPGLVRHEDHLEAPCHDCGEPLLLGREDTVDFVLGHNRSAIVGVRCKRCADVAKARARAL